MPNEATDFRSSRSENFSQVFLNREHYAESVAYQPAAGGPPRPVYAMVRRRVQFEEAAHITSRVEVVEIKVRRDETEGIAAPQLGDRIQLADDGPAEAFTFTGEVFDRTSHSHRLVFQRKVPHQIGKQVMGR